MKRALVILLIAAPALAQSWYDAYNRGVASVRAKNYAAGAQALEAAIREVPAENAKLRASREFITYLPHMWLGIARVGLNEPDAALAEFRKSEEQGVVQNTPFYAQMREWIAQAQQQKKRNAENAAAGSKRDANAAIGRAIGAQTEALTAGADRSDAYRNGQRKLQEALDAFNRAGTDVRVYSRAADMAGQAHELFAGAAAEARRNKAAAQKPAPKPQPQAKQPPKEFEIPFEEPKPQPPAPKPQPVVVQPQPQPPAPQPPALEAKPKPKPKPAAPLVVAQPQPVIPQPQPAPAAPVIDIRPDLEAAYRAFAGGDLAGSESLLTNAIAKSAAAEAYLLRGVTRYTRAMLSRTPEALLPSAAEDFRAALRLNGALRLSDGAFSPKLVAFFEGIRRGK